MFKEVSLNRNRPLFRFCSDCSIVLVFSYFLGKTTGVDTVTSDAV